MARTIFPIHQGDELKKRIREALAEMETRAQTSDRWNWVLDGNVLACSLDAQERLRISRHKEGRWAGEAVQPLYDLLDTPPVASISTEIAKNGTAPACYRAMRHIAEWAEAQREAERALKRLGFHSVLFDTEIDNRERAAAVE